MIDFLVSLILGIKWIAVAMSLIHADTVGWWCALTAPTASRQEFNELALSANLMCQFPAAWCQAPRRLTGNYFSARKRQPAAAIYELSHGLEIYTERWSHRAYRKKRVHEIYDEVDLLLIKLGEELSVYNGKQTAISKNFWRLWQYRQWRHISKLKSIIMWT